MRAVEAIYWDGRVYFEFNRPPRDGPVSVLVIFPPEPECFEEGREWVDDEPETSASLARREGIG